MKALGTSSILSALILSAGCGFSSTKVTERVIEHTPEAGGQYYALLCQVLTPTNLAGHYDVVATQRSDLISNVDGGVYEVYLNFTEVGTLTQNRPLEGYSISPPSPGSGDFLDSAKRIR